MSFHVICSGCLKRFQVSARFAGMQGPCPNCGTIIDIPKESVELHGDDDAAPKHKKRKRSSSPVVSRFDLEIDPVQAKYYVSGVFGVLLVTFLLGCVPMYAVVRSILGTLGLGLVAFPLVLFGYQALRDREHMFSFAGRELYRRAGMAAVGYVILWLGFEYCLAASQADVFATWGYLAAFAVLATLCVHPVLAMKMPDAFLHFSLFGFSVALLRWLIGFGWFWESSGLIRYSTAPPPPILPGM